VPEQRAGRQVFGVIDHVFAPEGTRWIYSCAECEYEGLTPPPAEGSHFLEQHEVLCVPYLPAGGGCPDCRAGAAHVRGPLCETPLSERLRDAIAAVGFLHSDLMPPALAERLADPSEDLVATVAELVELRQRGRAG
jgi:hypothetical protein